MRTEVGLRRKVVDGELYVSADDLLLALSAAEVAWEPCDLDLRPLRLFAARFSRWARGPLP